MCGMSDLLFCQVHSFLSVIDAESFVQCTYVCIYVSILKPYFSFIIGPVVYVLDLADRLISKACPFAAAGIMVGSIYWTAVTYGAVTVMQVHVYSLFLPALKASLLKKSKLRLLFPWLKTCFSYFQCS